MAITSVGYDGVVTEAQWAAMIPAVGSSAYGVIAIGDWKVSAHPSTAQAVQVAPGSGWGQGVYDVSDSTVTVQCDTIPSGTRYDLICARRNWSGTGGATTFSKVKGSTTKAIPSSRAVNPGTLDEQPLALVKWTAGQTQPSEIVDLRCWAGNGGMYAADALTLTYLKQLGAQVKMKNGQLYLCEVDGSGNAIWNPYQLGATKSYGRSGNYTEPANSAALGRFVLNRINIPDPGFPYHVHVDAVVEATGGGAGTRWDVIANINGPTYAIARGDTEAPWYSLSGTTFGNPLTGSSYMELVAYKQFGGGNFGLTPYNQLLSVTVHPAMPN